MTDAIPLSIAVIVPTLNEAESIKATVEGVLAMANGVDEVIVADGGSVDDTVAIATACGAKAVVSPPGRGLQLNAGAAQARGDVLLFLHADTRLPTAPFSHVRAALLNPQMVGGGFALNIDSDDRFLQMVARTATWRSRRYRMFYGDQAIFVRRELFERLGGFEHIPIMEDVALVRALRQVGELALVEAPVTTSARRWLRENPLYATLRNWVLMGLYGLGVSPHTLHRWYRPEKGE